VDRAATAISTAHRERHLRAYRVEVVLILGLIAFAVLAFTATAVPYFAFDVPVTRALQSIQWPPFETFLSAVNWIGFPPQSNVIFGSIVVALFLVGKRWQAAGLFVAAAGSAGLWFLLTPIIDRPRPSPDLVRVAGELPTGGFPSGHVLNLTAMIGFLMFLVFTELRPSWWRTLLLVLLAVPIVGIGLARVYSGQHWPSDVLGGYLLGIAWLSATIVLYRGARQLSSHGRAISHSGETADRQGDEVPAT
jgi:undecaprenyl-diphosphatase